MKITDVFNVFGRAVIPFRLIFVMWLLFVADYVYGYHFNNLGILPRNLYGLIGVITGPLLHVSLMHIVSNTFPLLILGAILFYFYFNEAKLVFYVSYIVPNVLVWIFARPIIHIGASGLIYSMATFLVIFGLLRSDFKSIVIAVAVMGLYSSLFFGLAGVQLDNVSYEMHFAGIIVGIVMAVYMRFFKTATSK